MAVVSRWVKAAKQSWRLFGFCEAEAFIEESGNASGCSEIAGESLPKLLMTCKETGNMQCVYL